MKLYATISSERASKGQGGNKFLKIDLMVGSSDNPENIATISVVPKLSTQEKQVLSIDYPEDKTFLLITPWDKPKGKQQKGEQHCDNPEGCSYCDIEGKPMS